MGFVIVELPQPEGWSTLLVVLAPVVALLVLHCLCDAVDLQLLGYAIVKIASPTFYALRDSRTPVIISAERTDRHLTSALERSDPAGKSAYEASQRSLKELGVGVRVDRGCGRGRRRRCRRAPRMTAMDRCGNCGTSALRSPSLA